MVPRAVNQPHKNEQLSDLFAFSSPVRLVICFYLPYFLSISGIRKPTDSDASHSLRINWILCISLALLCQLLHSVMFRWLYTGAGLTIHSVFPNPPSTTDLLGRHQIQLRSLRKTKEVPFSINSMTLFLCVHISEMIRLLLLSLPQSMYLQILSYFISFTYLTYFMTLTIRLLSLTICRSYIFNLVGIFNWYYWYFAIYLLN